MEKKIVLEFPNTISRLAGNSFGKDIYINQVKDRVDLSQNNVIVIPNTIQDIAISFVQGFTEEILEKIDLDEFEKYITIEGTEKVVTKFKKAVFY